MDIAWTITLDHTNFQNKIKNQNLILEVDENKINLFKDTHLPYVAPSNFKIVKFSYIRPRNIRILH